MILLLVQAAKEVLAGRISQNMQIEVNSPSQLRGNPTSAIHQRAISLH